MGRFSPISRVRISTCSWVAYAPSTFRATSPGENSLSVKTRKDTTRSVRSRNATCLRAKRATVTATLPPSGVGVTGGLAVHGAYGRYEQGGRPVTERGGRASCGGALAAIGFARREA